MVTYNPNRHKIGDLCKRGHVYKGSHQSMRYIKGNDCVLCALEHSKLRKEGLKPSPAAKQADFKIKYKLNERLYLGVLCRRKHDHDGTGMSLRTINRSACLMCERIYLQEYCEKNTGWRAKVARDWYAKNRDKWKEYHRQWAERNPVEYKLSYKRSAAKRRKAAKTFKVSVDHWKLLEYLCGGFCVYCGKQEENLTLDHVNPISKGGSHTLSNFLLCCHSCNASKRDKVMHCWYQRQSFYSPGGWDKILDILDTLYSIENDPDQRQT